MTYPNDALAEVCGILVRQYCLSPSEIANLAKDIPAECGVIWESVNEAAWERQQESLMESGGPDDSAYRKDIIAAGRGHLLKD
jgi:hypothetical protein